jgi:uncharacterized protein (DUF1697 family)
MTDQCSYLALLRGINVGGNNIIKMVDLKACFEQLGCSAVTTYIQSGNVVFSSDESPVTLEGRIEQALSERFGYTARIVLLTQSQLVQAVADAPLGFGSEPDAYRYDVLFLKPPLTAQEAMASVSAKPGVDTATVGVGVLYFSRLISRAAESYLAKMITMPVYKHMTIRNWNTTTKLLALINRS